MEKNSAYWEKRIAASTWKTYNSLEEKNRELLEFYIDASKAVKEELYQIAEKYSREGVLSLSCMHKQNRLNGLNKKFQDIIEDLGRKTEKTVRKNMQDGFKAVYNDTARGMGDTDFSMPNKRLMEKLLNEPWRGDNFSGRLWKNQKRLAVGLNDLLLTGLQQGKTVTEIAVNMHNFVGQGFNECHRLVRTETMHYLNDATLQRYIDAGVKYVQIWAAEDERTCDECSKYHGKIYPIDKCPHVPFHPNCRCTIIPCLDEKLIAEYEKKHGVKKAVEKQSGSGIIKASNTKEAVEVHSVGKINRDIYKCITKDIVTDEVIITENQMRHILDRHPEAYREVINYLSDIIREPDFIIEDRHYNTGLVIKKVKLKKEYAQMVLRICTSEDNPNYKNSVISCWEISERRLQNYLRNKRILYKKE